MKNKFLSLLITISILITFFPISIFANEENNREDVLQSIEEDMEEARKDGRITSYEQMEISKEYSITEIKEYNDIAQEEANEALKDFNFSMNIDSDSEISKKEVINLDCGAQLVITCEVDTLTDEEEIELENEIAKENEEKSLFTSIQEFICPTVFADTLNLSLSYKTQRYGQEAKVYGLGWASIKLDTWVKANSNGLTITKVEESTDSYLYFNDLDSSSWIEDKYAQKEGYDCHSRGKLKFNAEMPVTGGHTQSHYLHLRCRWNVTKIDKTNKVVKFKYTNKIWQE